LIRQWGRRASIGQQLTPSRPSALEQLPRQFRGPAVRRQVSANEAEQGAGVRGVGQFYAGSGPKRQAAHFFSLNSHSSVTTTGRASGGTFLRGPVQADQGRHRQGTARSPLRKGGTRRRRIRRLVARTGQRTGKNQTSAPGENQRGSAAEKPDGHVPCREPPRGVRNGEAWGLGVPAR